MTWRDWTYQDCILNSKDLIKQLEDAGWEVIRIKGSHHHLRHLNKLGTITVPHPKKALGIGLVRAIQKEAGLL